MNGDRTATTGARWSTLASPNDIGFGVYVHVPFCRHKCDYCAFATFTDKSHLVERYLRALRTEIERAAPSMPERPPSSSEAEPRRT